MPYLPHTSSNVNTHNNGVLTQQGVLGLLHRLQDGMGNLLIPWTFNWVIQAVCKHLRPGNLLCLECKHCSGIIQVGCNEVSPWVEAMEVQAGPV